MSRKESKMFVKDYVHPAALVVQEDDTMGQVLEELRKKKYEGKIVYFYAVDVEKHLLGIVSTRALLLSDVTAKVKEVMETSIISLTEDQTLEQAMETLALHRLLALPVVDEEKRLKGVIDVQMYLEDNVDIFKAQRSQDLFQMVGVSLEESVYKSPSKSYMRRMPWILCNMFGGLACAVISQMFHLVLGKVLILAMFIPLVLSLSESISMQSMTQSLQLLKKQSISWKKMLVRALLEFRVAGLMSLTSGVLVGVLSLFWDSGFAASAVICLGIMISVIVSAVVGALIPLFLHLKKLDPKVASGPVVLTLADVTTTALYLSLASSWLL